MGKLTDRAIRSLEAPGRHSDGDALYLVIYPSGAKNWVQRLVIQGQRHDLGLGPCPTVFLASARQKAMENRTLVKPGGNPLAVKRETEALAKTPSFEALARRHIAENSDFWRNAKHRAQWLSSLATYAFPSLGSTRVDEISRRNVIETLSPIWTSKPETARRVRQRRSPTSFTQTQNPTALRVLGAGL